MTILVWLIVGLVAGWIASRFTGSGSYGLIGDIVVGVVGAFAGGWMTARFLAIDVTGMNVTSITVAVAGAVTALQLFRAMSGGRWRVYRLQEASPRRRQTEAVVPLRARIAKENIYESIT